MIRAIIFDLYGVLIANSWQEFKHSHFDIGSPHWHEMVTLGRGVDAGTTEYETFVSYIAECTGTTETVVRGHLEHNEVNTRLLEFIGSTLKSHFKLGILSNANARVSAGILSQERASLFDGIIHSRDIGYVKPQPEMYLEIAKCLEVSPVECVYVDDQPLYVEGARAVEMTGLLYKSDSHLIEELEKYI